MTNMCNNHSQHHNGQNGRQQLDLLLDQGLANRLTLIVGPDAGKRSKALNQWLSRRNYPVLQIDNLKSSDGEVCFGAIIERFVDAGILTASDASQLSADDGQTSLTLLVNRLAELDRDLLIIFTDYEPCAVGDTVLTFLLEHLPNQIHLYVCSDDLPGLSCIPRLRVRRQLQTIDTSDN